MKYLLTLLFLFSIEWVSGQPCLDYGVFDGPDCVCAPPGWSMVVGTEEIDDMDIFAGTCNIPGPSPEGGSAVALNTNSGIDEAIVTTVNGLVAGQYYYLSFWWITLNCPNFCCSDLEVVINGESTVFTDADDWTLIEFCVFAESESIDIELNSIWDDGALIFIDDTGCMPPTIPCCPLIIYLNDEYEVCPNEPIVFDAGYQGETGNVTIEWESDPPDGIDYLSDINVLNPTFEYVFGDNEFDGITYVFTLIVEDDDCQQMKEMEVTILPLVLPTFDFELIAICESEGTFMYPAVSEEGISGSWTIDEIELSDFANQTFTNYFTPNTGEVDCPLESEHDLQIELLVTPTFEFPLFFCRSQIEEYDFPTSSIENIVGEWSPQSLIPDNWPDGNIIIRFTPYDLFCNNIIDLEIELESGDNLRFDLPDILCDDITEFIFPTFSDEGVGGFWDDPILDFSNLNGLYTNTFHAQDIECYEDYVFDFEISSSVNLTFDTISPICRSSDIIMLDSFSQQGIQGSWSIEAFDPDTISSDFVVSTWTPIIGQSNCVVDTTFTFEIINSDTPSFSIPSEICLNELEFIFPTTSDNGLIVGTWSVPSFSPSGLGVGMISSEFTSSDDCVNSFEAFIQITEPLEPLFLIDTNYCENESPFDLPSISDNGIEGTWTKVTINPQIGVQSIVSYFMPTDSEACYDAVQLDIEIIEATQSLFDLPIYLCTNSDELELPTISNNGILGSWNIPIVTSDILNESEIVNLVFNPDEVNCNASTEFQIQVIDKIEVIEQLFNPTACTNSDGSINLNSTSTNEYEYSIDNGVAWLNNGNFDNLSSGVYDVLVRDLNFADCQELYSFSLVSPNAPEITDLLIDHIVGCSLINGQIEIIASGDNLEYSIDNGVTWSQSNVFEMLVPDTYEIIVREQAYIDCTAESQAIINDFPLTQIEELSSTDLSDCNSNDGTISIQATGQNLEYSIDNGLTWQSSNVFEELENGVYEVIVRSIDAEDCFDELTTELLSPMVPEILNIETNNVSTCQPNIGSLLVLAQGNELEYSIDNGLTWQASNEFTNLTAGAYDVLVRERENMGCFDGIVSTIEIAQDALITPEIDIVGISDCILDDAIINIITSELNVEFSLDGLTWQEDSTFENLSLGSYQLLMRKVQNVDCMVSITFEIEPVECPCNDLKITIEAMPILCLDLENGSAEITDIQGVDSNNYNVLWDNGSTDEFVSQLSEGWYYVTIDYDEMCSWKDSIYIDKIDPLNFGLQTFDEKCQDMDDGIISVVNLENGTGPFNYSLNGIDYQTDNIFYNLTPDEYQVFVLDDNDCIDTKFVEIFAGNQIDFSLPAIVPIEPGNTTVLNPLINQTTIDSFVWEPQLSINNNESLVIEVGPEVTTEYTLTIYFGSGCTDERSVVVEVIEIEDDVYLPNIFSPESGDANSVLFPLSKSNSNITIDQFRIFDRWGNLIYFKENLDLNNVNSGWDGTFNGQLLNPGVFVFMINYSQSGKTIVKGGNITLIR